MNLIINLLDGSYNSYDSVAYEVWYGTVVHTAQQFQW